MPFMFLLSGLFVWPSLLRKGSKTFLYDRLLRLGVPFILIVYLLMPVTLYPAYRVTAIDPSWSAYWMHLLALPFWPCGPLWFLWQLLVFNITAAALYRFVPRSSAILKQATTVAGDSPGRYFIGLVIVSALAYVPLASTFKPWDWAQFGPFALQPGRELQYVVYFFAGLGLGAYGLERGLLDVNGILPRRWVAWVIAALATFVLWMMATALTMPEYSAPIPGAQIAADLTFIVSGATACFGFAAIFLRFATSRWPVLDNLSENSYGIFLVHYAFVVWLQYILLGTALPALVKGMIVFTGTLIVSWASIIALCRIPIVARLIGTERRASARDSPPTTGSTPQSGLRSEY
jgi:hypothetical protein